MIKTYNKKIIINLYEILIIMHKLVAVSVSVSHLRVYGLTKLFEHLLPSHIYLEHTHTFSHVRKGASSAFIMQAVPDGINPSLPRSSTRSFPTSSLSSAFFRILPSFILLTYITHLYYFQQYFSSF